MFNGVILLNLLGEGRVRAILAFAHTRRCGGLSRWERQKKTASPNIDSV
jgi:hypothetical protein